MKACLKLATAAISLGLLAGPALADTTVHVFLWDSGKGPIEAMNHKIEDHANPATNAMGVTPSLDVIPAGKVTFVVKNTSKDTIHEMVVSPLGANGTLPFDKEKNMVDEEKAGSLGEVSELDPGKSGTLSIDIKPGKYVLYCNVPGHYSSGMWHIITVKPTTKVASK